MNNLIFICQVIVDNDTNKTRSDMKEQRLAILRKLKANTISPNEAENSYVICLLLALVLHLRDREEVR